jgi:hypothetical protein
MVLVNGLAKKRLEDRLSIEIGFEDIVQKSRIMQKS